MWFGKSFVCSFGQFCLQLITGMPDKHEIAELCKVTSFKHGSEDQGGSTDPLSLTAYHKRAARIFKKLVRRVVWK
jgi:hypothetical protein